MTWDRTRSHGDLVHTANAAIALHQIDAGEHLRHQPRHQVLRVLGDPPCPLQRQVQQLLVFHRRHVEFAQNSLRSQFRPLSIRDDLRLEKLQLRVAFCSMVVTWLRSSFSPLVQSEHVSVPPRYLRMTGADVDILEAYAVRRYCNQKSLQIFSWNPAASSPYPDKRIPGRRMKCKWRQLCSVFMEKTGKLIISRQRWFAHSVANPADATWATLPGHGHARWWFPTLIPRLIPGDIEHEIYKKYKLRRNLVYLQPLRT